MAVTIDAKTLPKLFRSWVFYLADWLAVLVVLALGLQVFSLQTAYIAGASIPYPWVVGEWQVQLAFLAALYFAKR